MNFGYHIVKSDLDQQSPAFLALGTSFVEDSFSTDWSGGRVVVLR